MPAAGGYADIDGPSRDVIVLHQFEPNNLGHCDYETFTGVKDKIFPAGSDPYAKGPITEGCLVKDRVTKEQQIKMVFHTLCLPNAQADLILIRLVLTEAERQQVTQTSVLVGLIVLGLINSWS